MRTLCKPILALALFEAVLVATRQAFMRCGSSYLGRYLNPPPEVADPPPAPIAAELKRAKLEQEQHAEFLNQVWSAP